MDDLTQAHGRVNRRAFLLGGAGAAAGAALAPTVAWPGVALAQESQELPLLPTPEPIPGGIPIGLPPPYDFIHVFVPGPETVTLPFTGLQLGGLDVEPSTITNFRGATALAYVVGTATGSDGVEYGLEADMRAFEGRYVVEGKARRGTFAFI